RNKVGNNVSIEFRYLTHVWRFVVVAPGQIFSRESGLGHSCECVQSVVTFRKDICCDYGNTGRVKSPRNRCAGWTAATKAGSYRPVQVLLKCLNIVLIVRESYVGNTFRVPKLTL